MLELIDRAVRAVHEPEPAPLLHHVAGEFAPRVARLWPAPHAPYFAASAARRHLVCLVLAVVGDLDGERAAAALDAPLRVAVRRLVPKAPVGLIRALGCLGETAWSADDYRGLVDLLARDASAKPFRHAEVIRPEVVRRLRLAPPALAGAVDALCGLNEDAIRLLVECHGAIRNREGAAAADAVAERWGGAANAKAILALALDDMMLDVAPPPHPGTALLRPIATKAAFRRKAREYRNCLAGQLANAVIGSSAYYEWLGPPGAVVEIGRDAMFGWRLDQARMAGNRSVPKALRRRIIDELGLMGVHVGRTSWEIQHALEHRAATPDFVLAPADEGLGYLFEG